MGRRRGTHARRRRWGAALVVVALVAGLSALLASPASAAGFGMIGGTVTAAGGGPLAGIQVQVLNTTWGNTVATATTNGSGAYSKGTFTGSYKVRFHDPSGVRADVYSGG